MDAIQAYEREFTSSSTHEVSINVPEVDERMQSDIEGWWEKESRVAPIWFVWVTTLKPE